MFRMNSKYMLTSLRSTTWNSRVLSWYWFKSALSENVSAIVVHILNDCFIWFIQYIHIYIYMLTRFYLSQYLSYLYTHLAWAAHSDDAVANRLFSTHRFFPVFCVLLRRPISGSTRSWSNEPIPRILSVLTRLISLPINTDPNISDCGSTDNNPKLLAIEQIYSFVVLRKYFIFLWTYFIEHYILMTPSETQTITLDTYLTTQIHLQSKH